MATSGDDGIKKKFFWDLKRLFPQKPDVDGLVRDFENVGLKSNRSDTFSEDSKELHSNGGDGIGNSNMQHPIGPDAIDCSFFIRTGTCKFGPACKFNHPVLWKNLVDLGKSNGDVESLSRNWGQVPCKFYLKTGVCKNGESCRFSHSKPEAEKFPLRLELNVLGFPVRLGKKDCAFYMRTGICGYGVSCRFHHPDPIFVLEPELYSSVVTGEYLDSREEASAITDAGYVMHFPESTSSYFPLPLVTDCSFLYMHQNHVCSGDQAPDCNQETRSSIEPPAANVEMVVDHRQDPPKREPCVLNDVGLPIRPGKKVCWHYENLGLCKLGRACAYDHPERHLSTGPDGSTSESPENQD